MRLTTLAALTLIPCITFAAAAQTVDSCVQEKYAGLSQEIIQRKAAKCMVVAERQVRSIDPYAASIATAWGSRP